MGQRPGYVLRHVRDIPLKIKGLVLILIPLLALFLVITAFYLVQRENQGAQRAINHALEIEAQIQLVRTRIEQAQSSVLGYVISRDPLWLEHFRTAGDDLPPLTSQLATMAANNPPLEDRAVKLQTLVGDKLQVLRNLQHEAAEATVPRAVLLERAYGLDAIHNELDRMQAEENSLLEARRAHAQRVWNWSYAIIGGAAVITPAGAVLAVLFFFQGIARRIQLAEENARRLAEGRPVAPMSSGQDEIGRLERSLGEAASLLATRERQLRDAAGELESRVEQRTTELAEANTALQAEVGERKRAEQRLAAATLTLRAVLDAGPLAIVGVDFQGRVQSWNRGAEQIYGWLAAEALDRPLPVIPDGRRGGLDGLLDRAAIPLSGFETEHLRKDGQSVQVRVWTTPLRNDRGEIRGNILIAADVTEQRRLEQQFSQAQKMEAIGRLAGGVAHDFNNVITIISGYGQMLLEGVSGDPVLKESAEEVLRASDRAASLASQLLVFSRRQDIQPKVIDLNQLVSDFERMLSRVIGEDIELRTNLHPHLWAVRADPGQMEQVIMNLVVNGRDAMPGGGTISIETGNREIDGPDARARGIKPGDYVMLAVSDTGTGMGPEVRNHIFEPFFTTKERGKGTGLGLSTVYGIVKRHGGDIWVDTEPGRGTTFRILLPRIAAARAVEAPEIEEGVRPRGGTETILLVEDEDPVRRLVREILESRGYRVIEAESGERALQEAAAFEGRIELLVTDVVMPKMNGRDLAHALGLLRPEMKVLFLSGYTGEAIVNQGEHGRGAPFLQKPFTPDTLARKIRDTLDASRTA
jgi:two-component system cell cycle sensor histidine kinase/response regulator CckA